MRMIWLYSGRANRKTPKQILGFSQKSLESACRFYCPSTHNRFDRVFLPHGWRATKNVNPLTSCAVLVVHKALYAVHQVTGPTFFLDTFSTFFSPQHRIRHMLQSQQTSHDARKILAALSARPGTDQRRLLEPPPQQQHLLS